MRILFIRHGEPDYENDGLTETGLKQAGLLTKRLMDEGIGEIYTSPLGRAAMTALPASKALGIPVKTLDFMREVNWGSTDADPIFAGGHPWDIADELARQGINLNSPDWRMHPYFKTNSVLSCVERIEEGIDEWLAGFGYIREGYYYRHTLEEKEHRSIALFCHGGSSAAAMGHLLNLPFPYACALFHLEFTGITIIRLDRTKGSCSLPCLELANDGRHIHETADPELIS